MRHVAFLLALVIPLVAPRAQTYYPIPVTAGMSEWSYINLDANNQQLPASFAKPIEGGPIIPDWVGQSVPDGHNYTYEILPSLQGNNVRERLLDLSHRLVVGQGQPGTAGQVIVQSASFRLLQGFTLWNGALITIPNASSYAIEVTTTGRFDRQEDVSFCCTAEGDPLPFRVRGGKEPGGFVLFEGKPIYQANRNYADNACDETSTGTYTHPSTFTMTLNQTYQGQRVKVGAYAQVGELALQSVVTCGDPIPRSASVFDVEAVTLNYFRSYGDATLALQPLSPATYQVSVSNPSGEYISRVWMRTGSSTYTEVGPNTPPSQMRQVTVGNGDNFIIVETSTGKIGKVHICYGTCDM